MRRTQLDSSAVRKPNRKKKDYTNVDVNGFMEYLQQSGRPLPRGEGGARELREEVEIALKKDRRREDRRIKRQTDKKSQMVSAVEPPVRM